MTTKTTRTTIIARMAFCPGQDYPYEASTDSVLTYQDGLVGAVGRIRGLGDTPEEAARELANRIYQATGIPTEALRIVPEEYDRYQIAITPIGQEGDQVVRVVAPSGAIIRETRAENARSALRIAARLLDDAAEWGA